MRLTQLLNESVPTVDKSLLGFFLENTTIVTQMHIYHLITKNGAEHTALFDFYNTIDELNDKLIETLMGLGAELEDGKDYTSKISMTYSKSALLSKAEEYRAKVTEAIEKTSGSEFASVNDILVDAQAAVDTLLYKLRLK